MAWIYLKLCVVAALTIAQISSNQDIPKQMRRLYKQYKRGNILDGNINTVRYIQAHKGSVTSSKNLIYNLNSLYKEGEKLVKAELHYYRRSIEEMKTIQMDVSELSPYYISLAQRERRSPSGKGWQLMDITKTVRQCTNTINTYNQVGVAFSEVNTDNVAVPVDMPTFLRHHSVPFILLYSQNNRSLETDQITARSGQKTEDMVNELNSLINPVTGKSIKRSRRSVHDNRINVDSDISNDIPPLHEWLSVDDLYNEMTNEVEIGAPQLQELQDKLLNGEMSTISPTDTAPLARTDDKKERVKSKVQYIPWPSTSNHKNKKKNRNIELLPTNKRKYSESDTLKSSTGCGRKSLRINFEDIGWGDRVIEPKKFEAYYCSGECNFPNSLGKHMTNHATLQSLLTSIQVKTGVPKPCCVPQKLEPVTLMYYDENNSIVLKRYPDMSVRSCACR